MNLVIYRPNPSGYGDTDVPPLLVRIGRRLSATSRTSSRDSLLLNARLASSYFFFSLWGLHAIFKYDVFVFGFGHSLLPFNADLPILRILGKRVVANLYHGSEIRPPFANGALRRGGDGAHPSISWMARKCRRIKKRANFFEKNVTTVIGAPLTSSPYLEKEFVNIFALGIATDLHDLESESSLRVSRTVRILHAPSNPSSKGTTEIRAIVRDLNAQGLNLELVEVIGRPNAEVHREIKKCDFVVDQIYSDIPFPTFTIEAGTAGKASVVGGYSLEGFEKFIPGCERLPVEVCSPGELRDSIRKLALNVDYRTKLGEEARAFLATNWSYAAVGSKFAAVIRGKISPEWLMDPRDVSYPWGCSQAKSATLEIVKAITEKYGWQTLQLNSRHDIQSQLELETT